MINDEEGFAYPFIADTSCTKCNSCRLVCPSESYDSTRPIAHNTQPLPKVFAAWSRSEATRKASSSGGVFTELAQKTIADGGLVIGAAFDQEFQVRHVIAESLEEIEPLRGSKYVQSAIAAPLFHRTKAALLAGRRVLFVGTPCQIAGLRGYLKRDFERLLCCDLICHGVPSPLLWRLYLDQQPTEARFLVSAFFRDKTNGWARFGLRLQYADGRVVLRAGLEDPYLAAFLLDVALRECCYSCLYANSDRTGDITLADFWGVSSAYPEYNADDKGTSLVLLNTPKGAAALEDCRAVLFLGPADITTASRGNPSLSRPSIKPQARASFYKDLLSHPFADIIQEYKLRPPTFVETSTRILKAYASALIKKARSILGVKRSP